MGGKYTSARADAAELVSHVCKALGRDPGPCPTTWRPFPWRPEGRYRTWQQSTLGAGLRVGLDEETILACQLRYGRRVEVLFQGAGAITLVSHELSFTGGAHGALFAWYSSYDPLTGERLHLDGMVKERRRADFDAIAEQRFREARSLDVGGLRLEVLVDEILGMYPCGPITVSHASRLARQTSVSIGFHRSISLP